MESTVWQVLVFSLVGGALSLVGGIVLLRSRLKAEMISSLATPFAAGALLAAAFLDLLKEAGEQVGPSGHSGYEQGLLWALIGILIFFLLEGFLSWFHHHHQHEEGVMSDPRIKMVVIGDSLHNLIDGLAIGAAFIISPQTGIVAALAVAAHEIPQEVGDFGLLLSKGLAKRKILYVNLLSAVLSSASALLVFMLGKESELNLAPLLGLVAGMFIYIAVSDIIPEIHKRSSTGAKPKYRSLKRAMNLSSAMLILGVVVVGGLAHLLH